MNSPSNLKKLHLSSFSKINAFLYVTKKRKDGYHTLKTVFCPLYLSDTVILSFQTNQISISCDSSLVPVNSENICWKAAELFFKETHLPPAVSIQIIKRIPVAAGLGGGSSNAAAVLLGLNQFHQEPLSFRQIQKLALQLGADVPFFLLNKPAYAQGIGEELTVIPKIKPYWVLLVCPSYSVSTAEVYEKLTFSLTNVEKHPKNPSSEDIVFDMVKHLHNDLESVTFKIHSTLSSQKEQLLQVGAVGSLMSGSGPTLFGLFESEKKAISAIHSWVGNEQLILTRLKLH